MFSWFFFFLCVFGTCSLKKLYLVFCLFSEERKKGRYWVQGGGEGGETMMRIYYIKVLFSKERKNEIKSVIQCLVITQCPQQKLSTVNKINHEVDTLQIRIGGERHYWVNTLTLTMRNLHSTHDCGGKYCEILLWYVAIHYMLSPSVVPLILLARLNWWIIIDLYWSVSKVSLVTYLQTIFLE